MPQHVTINDLESYLTQLVRALDPGALARPYLGLGGILPTVQADGLVDSFNHADPGGGFLGTSDFGSISYTYGPGVPKWKVDITQKAIKTDAAGASALLDFGYINQCFGVDVVGNQAETAKVILRASDDGSVGYVASFSYDAGNNGQTKISLETLDGAHVYFAAGTAQTSRVNLFDGEPHSIVAAVNIGDFLLFIDGHLALQTKTYPVDLQSGTKVGFDATGTLTTFDNVRFLAQPYYNSFAALAAHTGNLEAEYEGGYPLLTKIGGTGIPDSDGAGGLQSWLHEPSDNTVILATDFYSADVDMAFGWGYEYAQGEFGLALRVSADNSTAAVCMEVGAGGLKVYEGYLDFRDADAAMATPIYSQGYSNTGGSFRAVLKGQVLDVYNDRANAEPTATLTLDGPVSTTTRHAVEVSAGNYSYFNALTVRPL